MHEFWQSVQDTPAPRGTAVLWWLGQMGLLIKMGDEVLCLDLYAADAPNRQVPCLLPARLEPIFLKATER